MSFFSEGLKIGPSETRLTSTWHAGSKSNQESQKKHPLVARESTWIPWANTWLTLQDNELEIQILLIGSSYTFTLSRILYMVHTG